MLKMFKEIYMAKRLKEIYMYMTSVKTADRSVLLIITFVSLSWVYVSSGYVILVKFMSTRLHRITFWR